MFEIFTSFSNPISHKRSKSTPIPLISKNCALPSPTRHDLDEPVLTLPATAYSSPSRKAPQLPHTRILTGDSLTQLHKFVRAESSWSPPPLTHRSSGWESSQASNSLNDLSPLKSSLRSAQLEDSSHASYPSSPTKGAWLPSWRLSGDQKEETSQEDKGRTLASWFQGESGPISLGLLPSPTKQSPVSENKMSTSPISHPLNLQKRPGSQAPSKPPLASRFSFFASKSSVQKPPSPLPDLHDEFLDLDISKSLFPAGPADPFSPAAFKNLVQNAEGLLTRLQAAYRERAISLHEMTVEKETQSEELEGAETRAKHLKIQLDDMSAKMAKQDELMMDMVDDLAREKQLRREEGDVRKRSVMLVKPSGAHASNLNIRGIPDGEESQRKSVSTFVSDSGLDSEEESYVDSVYSKPREANSRNASVSSFSSPTSLDGYTYSDPMPKPPAARLPAPAVRLPTRGTPQAPSTFPSAPRAGGHASRQDEPACTQVEKISSTCANCQGARSSQAWSMVQNLREENRVLKARVVQIESALDGCLDVVTRLGG